MKRITSIIFCMAAMAVIASQADALNIVLTNDDGYRTPNIQAMYNTLKAEGHDVVISAPLKNQSSASSSMDWFVKVSLHADRDNPDIHMVDGTPVMAVLYGIDILSIDRWGTYPDLVISGPNQGNNLGIITNHSGTVGAVVTALYRGIPAIAVSADINTKTDGTQEMVARTTIRVITALIHNEPLLPLGTGISLNFPTLVGVNNPDDVPFVFSEIGTSGRVIPKFTMDLGRDSGALTFLGYWPQHYPNTYWLYHNVPGVSVGDVASLDSLPEMARHPEAELLVSGKATISVINVTYSASTRQRKSVHQRLMSLVNGGN